MKTLRYVLYAGAAAAVLVLALVAGLNLRRDNAVVGPPSSTATASPTPTVTATTAPSTSPPATASPTPATGTIIGRLGYPSDFVPQLTVYAISVTDPNVWFSTDTPHFGNGSSPTPPGPTWPPEGPGMYRIAGIRPGTYYVLAYRNDNNAGIGIYSQHTANCLQASQGGQTVTPAPGCAANDQSLLPVTVRAGETVTRIDIIDWAFQQNGYPPRPH